MSRPEPYSKIHLELDELPLLTTPWRELGSSGVALGLIRLTDGRGYTFTHHHERQEEVYVVVAGRGAMQLEDGEIPLERGDVVRVAPATRRALQAAEGHDLLVVCAGGVPSGREREPNARYGIDDGVPHYDDPPRWYAGDPEVARRNAELAERRRRSLEKRGGGPTEGA